MTKLLSVPIFIFFLANVAEAATYQNTPEEKTTFSEFTKNYKGTLICEPISNYIYGKGKTTYLVGDEARQKFYISIYNNITERWIEKNVEMLLVRNLDEHVEFQESGVDWGLALELGIGQSREMTSWGGDAAASAKFPFAGSADYQFHNSCRIELGEKRSSK